MMPRTSGALANIFAHQSDPPFGWLAPRAVVSHWMPMQPTIGDFGQWLLQSRAKRAQTSLKPKPAEEG